MDIEGIANRIKTVREKRGLTLEDIATATGVARSTIQRYETAKIGTPKNTNVRVNR